MVGMTIGLLATLVIAQVMSVFEAQKRTTTGTADAQTNGGIALYNIGRDLQLAGYPLMPHTNSALECNVLTFGATGITDISPVAITDGVAVAGVSSASDTITIRYGNSQMGGVPTQILSIAGNALTIGNNPPGNNLGCNNSDIALIINGNTCAMTSLASATDAPPGLTGTTTVNLVDNSAITAGAAANGADIACLGTWGTITYAVNNGNLQRTGADSVADIVNLQAQYGISTTGLANTDPNYNQVTQWVNASGGTWAAPTVANRNRIKAVRIAVVARNPKIEPSAVTTACSSTTAANPTGLCAWEGSALSPAPAIDLSAGDANWARYRYRVFETIIPLRNVMWAKDTLPPS